MNSSMIGKIEKARRYAEEPGRAQIQELNVKFQGEHDTYNVSYHDSQWSCDCHSFTALQAGTCSHIMAMERLLGQMIPGEMLAAAS
ncbi:MAG: hypothetical protein WBW04_17795 [Nitrolancea sp.]